MKKKYFFLCGIGLLIVYCYVNRNTNFITSNYVDNNLLNLYNTDIYQNSDIIGYIEIENTRINDFILQGNNNSYYLKHTKNHLYDEQGEIFLDYRNHVDDKKLLIYGHNFKNGSGKFHDLVKYVDKSFYKDNQFIKITFEGVDKLYQIFSVMLINTDDDKHMKLYFDDQEYDNYLKELKRNALYETGIDVDVEDRIIILQTCYYDKNNRFLVVNAKEIGKGEYEEKI